MADQDERRGPGRKGGTGGDPGLRALSEGPGLAESLARGLALAGLLTRPGHVSQHHLPGWPGAGMP